MSATIALFQKMNVAKLFFLALVVGVGGGLGSIVFHHAINAITHLSFGAGAGSGFIVALEALPWYYRLLVPTLGGLLVGIIIEKSALKELRGEGVPEVVESLAVARGKITPRVAPLKILTSAITLGTGGSAGREGPIIQIGSAIGSAVGQKLKLSTEHTRILLAAGAAAGIAGTFGAPLAGIVFSAEILLRRLSATIILVLMLAALTGSFVANYLAGLKGLSFSINDPMRFSVYDVPTVIGLGVVAALIAIIFATSLRLAHKGFARLTYVPEFVKPAIGGFLVGCIALSLPVVHEPPSYAVMASLLDNPATMTLTLVLAILVAKVVATSITLGSGGSGGILAPTLFIGVLTGSAFGALVRQFAPSLAADTQTLAVLGMAAVLTAVAHAPLSAIVIVIEIAEVEHLLLPLILVASVSYGVVRLLRQRSVYSIEG